MWFEDVDVGGRGIVQPAKGPLGRALRWARHDLFLSQEQIARIAGVSQATVSRLERGAPNWSVFCRIVDAIGARPVVTVERLLTPREVMAAYIDGDDHPNGPDAHTSDETGDWW